MTRFVEKGKRGLREFFVWAGLSAALIAVGIQYYWMFSSTKSPVTIITATPTKSVFNLNEPIVIEETIYISKKCPGRIDRYITDSYSSVNYFKFEKDPLLNAKSNKIRIEFILPKTFDAGLYTYHSEATWWCNPLKPTQQVVAEVPFVVTNQGLEPHPTTGDKP